MQLARTDAQIGTSLLESRLLLGNGDVYGRFSELMKAHDRAARRRRWPKRSSPSGARSGSSIGETVYLLEPNVKRSRGGLRDIHLLRWLWYLKAGVADPDRLHDMGHDVEVRSSPADVGAELSCCACGTRCTFTPTKRAMR